MGKLEKAAWTFVESYHDTFRHPEESDYIYNAFKAGAEWQKQQSEQNERDKMFAASLIGADMAKSKWISVKDKLPNPGVPVLVRTRNNKFTVTSRDVVYWDWNGSTAFADSITHWMPIPELPKGGEE